MRTLRGRLLALVGAAVLTATLITVAVGVLGVRHRLDRPRRQQVARAADSLAAARPAGLHVYLQRATGSGGLPVLVELGPGRARRAAARAGTASSGTLTGAQGRRLLFARRTSPRGTVIVLGRARAGSPVAFGPFRDAILLGGLAGLLVAGLLAAVLARRLARPLRELAAATGPVAEGRRLDVDLGPGAVTEVEELARAFMAMAHDLADARDAERAFLLSVSHELKTPLTAIRGYAEALEEGAATPEGAGPVITAEARRLERLVQDLLDLARAGRSDFAVRDEPVDLGALARGTAERHGPAASAAGITLTLELKEPAPARGDPDRLAQALSNLVENALRATPAAGRVTITARPGRMSVSDTGPGLAPEDLPRAFERFHLYERYRGDRAVGTGLGLAIVRQLVTAMGGTATVTSSEGDGATFTLALRDA